MDHTAEGMQPLFDENSTGIFLFEKKSVGAMVQNIYLKPRAEKITAHIGSRPIIIQ